MRLQLGCSLILLGLIVGKRINDWSFALVVVLAQEKLVLLNGSQLHLLLLFLGKLFVQQLLGWDTRLLEKDFRFEPAICHLELSFDLLPYEMQLIDGFTELTADQLILIKAKLFALIFSKVESIERVLQGERVSDLELFPSDDTTSSNLVGLYLEPAVFITE